MLVFALVIFLGAEFERPDDFIGAWGGVVDFVSPTRTAEALALRVTGAGEGLSNSE